MFRSKVLVRLPPIVHLLLSSRPHHDICLDLFTSIPCTFSLSDKYAHSQQVKRANNPAVENVSGLPTPHLWFDKQLHMSVRDLQIPGGVGPSLYHLSGCLGWPAASTLSQGSMVPLHATTAIKLPCIIAHLPPVYNYPITR